MIQLKRGPESVMGEIIPQADQPVYTTDTHKLKIGDGESSFSSLPSLSVVDALWPIGSIYI